MRTGHAAPGRRLRTKGLRLQGAEPAYSRTRTRRRNLKPDPLRSKAAAAWDTAHRDPPVMIP
jgi:hypothetical protein